MGVARCPVSSDVLVSAKSERSDWSRPEFRRCGANRSDVDNNSLVPNRIAPEPDNRRIHCVVRRQLQAAEYSSFGKREEISLNIITWDYRTANVVDSHDDFQPEASTSTVYKFEALVAIMLLRCKCDKTCQSANDVIVSSLVVDRNAGNRCRLNNQV